MSSIPKEDTDKKSVEELKSKYGVIKEIPKRNVENVPKPFEGVIETSKEQEEIKLHDLILRLEKIDGKIEIVDRFRNDMNERVTQLAEEIGELRTVSMERERSFDKIRTEFEKIKEIVSDFEPSRIRKEAEKREKEILENSANIEKLESLVKALGEENKKFREMMGKIKSFENLVDISYDINRKLSKINEVKDYADKIASKVESVFSELNEKVSELEGQREKIRKIDELTIEMTKMLDEVSIKLSKFAEKKDIDKLKKDIEEDVNKMVVPSKGKNVSGKTVSAVPVFTSKFSEEIERMKIALKKQNAVIANLMNQLKVENIEAGETQSIRNIKLSLRFFQIMNILPLLRDSEKIKPYLTELKEIAQEMKSNGIWNKEKEDYMGEVLDNLTKNLKPMLSKGV